MRRHTAIADAWHHIAIDNQTQKEKRLKALEEHIADDRFKGVARQQTPREMFENFRRIAGGGQKRQKREAKAARAEAAAAAAQTAEKVEGD